MSEVNLEVPAKFKDLVGKIEQLPALELSELVKVLEQRFGVSAAAIAAPIVAGVAGTPASGEEAVVEEKTSFAVVLKGGGQQKIQVIKVVRELTGKGLKESKDLVDGVPKTVAEGVDKARAEEMKKKLEEVGATVELQ